MSIPPSRAQSEVFSASQYDGPLGRPRRRINHFLLPTFILSLIGLACLFTLWYYLSFTSLFPFHHRVFYCRDINLYYPNFRPEDFQVYISYALLYALCFLLPVLVIIIGEVLFWLFSTKPRKTVYASCGECPIHLFSRRLMRFIGVFLFGALIVQIFVYTVKLMTGYQRPYFLTLCNVNMSRCTSPMEFSPSPSPGLACNYRNPADLRYAWLSFPSLHAAFSAYSAVFISLYIYHMLLLRGAPLLRPLLIFGFLSLSLLASFARISGYKNHWMDVIVGWLFGAGTAYFLCHSLRRFSEYYYSSASTNIARNTRIVEERISPFFSWFRLPRVRAPSLKEEYIVYEEDAPQEQQLTSADIAAARHRRNNQDRTYEVTTTTESFHRTISPPQSKQQQPSGYPGY
ncbi:hypothetical protein AB6A40_005173 [Gnathostoma spinigerum]|uniref:Phosphatidic acid phosphatase type 2/haloperoxidase domain-containing protein n=1 Tax=Gnathostoma spinigerum TaxID=75299 RepID=A0ABD6EEN8_9BILA